MRGILRRRAMAAVLITVSSVLGAAVAYASVSNSRHRWILQRAVANTELARLYLTTPPFRRFITTLERQDDHSDVFATMWDSGEGVMLSRHLFRAVTMDGAPRYMYHPNVRKLGFRTGAGGVFRSMETVDTPAIREALQALDTPVLAAASYDDLGFRRTVPDDDGCDERAVFLGDSFTDGLWVNDAETFVSQYAQIARRESGVRLCAINTGVNGYGSVEEAWVLEHYFDRLARPRLVVVMHYPNDVTSDEGSVIDGTAGEAGWRANVAQLDRIARFTRDRGATMVLAAIPPGEQVRGRASGQHYQDRLRAYAADRRIPFVDLLEHLQGTDAHRLYWTWDPHFTPEGHRVVADILFRQTKELIEAKTAAALPVSSLTTVRAR